MKKVFIVLQDLKYKICNVNIIFNIIQEKIRTVIIVDSKKRHFDDFLPQYLKDYEIFLFNNFFWDVIQIFTYILINHC